MSFHICFFLFFVQFSLSIVKNKNKKSQKKKKEKKKERKKRSNWTKLPRKSKEENKLNNNNNNNRQCPNEKEKKIKKNEQALYSVYRPNHQKKRGKDWTSPCASAYGYFRYLSIKFYLLIFFSILKRKYFARSRENTPRLYQFFSLPSPQPNTHQKSFHSHFLSKIFLHIFFLKFSVGKIFNS